MKQFSTVLKAAAVMAASLLLFSCSKPKVIELSVSPQTVNFDAAAGEKTVSVSCNDSWTVTASQAWVSVSQSNGENNGAVKISVTANETFSDRFADVTVKSGEKSVNVVVSQMGMNPSMGLTGSNIEAKVEGGTFEVIVTTNTEWTVATPSVDWVSVSPASGKGDGKIVVTVKPTDLYETRATEIAVESKQLPLPATIKVKQEALTYTARQLDSLALVALYTASDGANWPKEENRWDLTKPMSEWKGVTLTEDRVTSVKLGSTSSGTISTEWTLPEQFSNLTELTEFRVVKCSLKGDVLPIIQKLSKLKILYLTNNKVTSTVTADFFALTSLTDIYIDQNPDLGGTLTAEIGNLKSLKNLNISKTSIGGTIPAELVQCESLVNFMAYENKLSGEIPDFWDKLPNMGVVQLYGNPDITGPIPATLGGLKKMTGLQLKNCNLTGNIPASFGGLEKCNNLQLNGNKLSGVVPAEVQAHKNWQADKGWKYLTNILPQQDGYGLTLE